MLKLQMLMHALEVLCNEPWCCILCWQFDMQFSYATHLAHPFLCRPTHFNISGYASAVHPRFLIREGLYSHCFCSLFGKCVYKAHCHIRELAEVRWARPEHVPVDVIKSHLQHSFRVGGPTRHFPLHRGFLCEPLFVFRCEENGGVVRFTEGR